VTAIHETTCKEMEWHIARLPKTFTKACFAHQAVTKTKCTAKIVQDNKNYGPLQEEKGGSYLVFLLQC
jgi:hypothetical protein